jgi:putative hydrolase of the HAD superfamily
VALRAVLLDVDDTLVDTRGAFRAAITSVVRRWLPHLDAGAREAAVQRWALDPGGHFRAYTRGEVDFETQRRRRAADLHEAFGGPALDDEGARRWAAGYEDAFRRAWRPCPDARPFLAAVRAAGLRTAAVTNMLTSYQIAKLDAVGLAGQLAAVVGLDVVGVGKPDPRPFLHACGLLGVAAGEAAYVGDELDVDARAARDAGLLGVWLDRHGSGEEPGDVPVVRGLGEVPALLGLATPGGRSPRC